MYPWTVPDELVRFVFQQFEHFGAEPPPDRVVNFVLDYIIRYVSRHRYYPATAAEVLARYERPGLTEVEKYQLLPPLEYPLKLEFPTLSIHQLHLAAWAALLFCWSQEGDEHVYWYLSTQVADRTALDEFPAEAAGL